jgi:diaminohydroxyphosphoribosylaminopyrimidine deaminase/5-amino-6-(5-phosphoribosylamino)uracil reductase
VDVGALLAELHRRDVRAVLVEGGGETHGAFLDAGAVDRVAVFVAPRLLGARSAPAVIAGTGFPLKEAVSLTPFEVTPIGGDLLLQADVLH